MIFAVIGTFVTYFIIGEFLPEDLKIAVLIGFFVASILFGRHSHGSDMLILEMVAQNSKLKDISPIVKFLLVSATIVILVALRPFIAMAVIVGLVLCLFIFYEKNGLHIFADLMKDPLIFVFLGIVGILVDFSKEKIGLYNIPFGSFYIVISSKSISEARRLLAVSFTSLSLLITLGATTPMGDLIGAFRKLRIPNIIVEIMYLMYRYLFSLISIFDRLNRSAKARFGFDNAKNTMKTASLISSRLMNKSMRLAFASMNAMESRLYDGSIRFLETDYSEKKSIIAAIIYFAVLFVLIYFERCLR